MKQADIQGFEDAYTKWAVLKKENRLFPGDQEPRPADYGLIAWAADQVKKRVEREINRPV